MNSVRVLPSAAAPSIKRRVLASMRRLMLSLASGGGREWTCGEYGDAYLQYQYEEGSPARLSLSLRDGFDIALAG